MLYFIEFEKKKKTVIWQISYICQNSDNYTLRQKQSETLIKLTWTAKKFHISLTQEISGFSDFWPPATPILRTPVIEVITIKYYLLLLLL